MRKQLACGRHRFAAGLALVGLLGAVAGCGGKATGEVSGPVSYRGRPLPSGTVTFFDPQGQIVGTSSIHDGKYKAGKVPTGPVTITVTTPNLPPRPRGAKLQINPPDRPAPVESIPIPPMYASPDKSGLKYEVKSGPQEYPLELK